MNLLTLCGMVALYLTSNLEANQDVLHHCASDANFWLTNVELCANFTVGFTLEQKKRGYDIVTQGLNKFAMKFFENIGATTCGSFVCGPLSVSLALSMAVYGARHNTKKELARALGFKHNDIPIARAGFRTLMDSLANVKNVNLRASNKLGIPIDGVRPKRTFSYVTRNFLRSTTESLNFNETANDRKRIVKNWLNTQANDTSEHIISMSTLTFDPLLVLASEVYLKTDSIYGFDKLRYHSNRFWENGVQKGIARFLDACDHYRHGELPELDSEFVELPYGKSNLDDGVSMVIVLPKQRNGLKNLEKKLDRIEIKNLLDGELKRVRVYLPRFDLENFLWLESPLQNMGLRETFSPLSNFSKVVSTSSIHGYASEHAARIQVKASDYDITTEDSSISCSCKTLDEFDVTYFKVDHPFIAIVVTRSTNPVILQMARFTGV
ncbi:antichymotrypsin-2-like [Venturia canescens]|uniref:antichymotrypsin-2-like n=1 Tax=Venturia canescens TaxID=32260 RepID=UPI001C9CF6C8|nr:antichymotrypsin-2-like [Venturia canescens]